MGGFDIFMSGLGASCLCAAPIVALAAFDLDGSRPLTRALNLMAVFLIAVAVVAAFL